MLVATSIRFNGHLAQLLEVRLLQAGEFWPGEAYKVPPAGAGFWAGTYEEQELLGRTWSDLMRWVREQHDAGADVTIYSDRSTT